MNRIHVGVGGWTFEPWRNNFYPAGLPHSRELQYASRRRPHGCAGSWQPSEPGAAAARKVTG